MYGRYFWTRVAGAGVTVLGDRFEFKDADSHRARLGARARWNEAAPLSAYAGAAWEYEFDGRARATVYGYAVPAPSLRGGTTLVEAGLAFRAPGVRGLSAELGLEGQAGRRRGVAGGLALRHAFN